MTKITILYFFCFTFLLVAGSKHSVYAQEPVLSNSNDIIRAMTGLPTTNTLDLSKIAANIIFSGIGFVAFMYGKKNALWRPMLIGVALMAYCYFLSETLVIYIVGIALTAALYFWRE